MTLVCSDFRSVTTGSSFIEVLFNCIPNFLGLRFLVSDACPLKAFRLKPLGEPSLLESLVAQQTVDPSSRGNHA